MDVNTVSVASVREAGHKVTQNPKGACQGLTGHGSCTHPAGEPFYPCREQRITAFDIVFVQLFANQHVESYQITSTLQLP
jgi:hypothetical protein